MMKAILELIGQDYRAIRGAINVATTSHKGERDSDLLIKALGMGLFTIFSLIRGIGPTLGLSPEQLPGLDIIAVAISLSGATSGLYLFRRASDLRRGEKMASTQQPEDPQAKQHDIVLADNIDWGHEGPPPQGAMDDEAFSVELLNDMPAPPKPKGASPVEDVLEILEEAAEEIEVHDLGVPIADGQELQTHAEIPQDKPSTPLARIKARLARAMPAAPILDKEPRHRLHDGAQVSGGEASDAPSCPTPPPLAPLGGENMAKAPPPVVRFPGLSEDEDALGDLEEDPEQLHDDDDLSQGASGGLADFDFDEDDFENALEILPDGDLGPARADDLSAQPRGVRDEKPKPGPRGRVDGPRGKPPVIPPRRRG